MLTEIPISVRDVPIPAAVGELAAEAERRSKQVRCFGYVASNETMVYRVLDSLERGTFCEWGSGMGINTGIAALLGHRATGIELEPELAEASKKLLADFGLEATILTGSYYEIAQEADYYYVYCWPSQMNEVQEHFLASAPSSAKLLICHGADDVRCKVKSREAASE